MREPSDAGSCRLHERAPRAAPARRGPDFSHRHGRSVRRGDVDRLRQELCERLAQRNVEAERRGLRAHAQRTQREIARLITAIKAGVAVESIRAELERCEQRQREIEQRLAALDRADPARAIERLDGYQGVLAGLLQLAATDVIAARQQLKMLLDRITLIPYEDAYLIAHVTGSLSGLLELTCDETSLLVWRDKGAGVGQIDDRSARLVATGLVGRSRARNHLCRTFMAWVRPSRHCPRVLDRRRQIASTSAAGLAATSKPRQDRSHDRMYCRRS